MSRWLLTWRYWAQPQTLAGARSRHDAFLHALCRKAGQPAADLLEQVLARLGMQHSSFGWQPCFQATAAVSHRGDGQALARHQPDQPRAAGSLHTTMADYMAFALAVLADGADEIFEPSVLLDEMNGRSLGWGTVRSSGGQVAWQHGDNLGLKHLAGLRRGQGDGVLIFTNGDNGRALCRAVFQRTLGTQPW